ncbi:molybdenum cofactor guanylyltransferase [Candidimonas sp. SYP-B2681]|uniref:molybdenum cofactor guanylyltransferase MobA n=1 Tax=Candidimonas sp. SYP-B2681 TaxID=2497686 RepID=UPI000F87B6C6|nr:molybdenum cofactor guanylyltransferase MobA [Candidimonas sp. SYP-B2681]RTZ40693.1 molybdenum cofactor guanylyltransferase [Candidimonas sp. SYP-B2681]
MITRDSLTGLVLAGGLGRRMQGSTNAPVVEKGLLDLNGIPLVAHAQRFLAPHVAQVLISANRCLDAYAEYGATVPDDEALGGYSGPLAGIATALNRIDTPWLAVIPVDVPLPPAELIPRLISAVESGGAHLAYARTAERVHPLCMLVHQRLLQSLYDFLLAGERKVQVWQQLNGAVPVWFEDSEDAFFNVNTPEDLIRAAELVQGRGDYTSR